MADEDPYGPGGRYWESVVRIVQECGCTPSLAIAALKARYPFSQVIYQPWTAADGSSRSATAT